MEETKRAILHSLIICIRERIESLTDDERKQIFDDLTDSYCKDCGSELPCYCMNDE